MHLHDETSKKLFKEVCSLINEAKSSVSTFVNSALVLLYWNIGAKINQDVIGNTERAEYGERVIIDLAKKLTLEYGKGFNRANLFRMIQFNKTFPDFEIVATLSKDLSWSHFVEIFVLKDPLKMQFYSKMCRIERWGVRSLRSKIQGMLYERTALSKNTESFIIAVP